MVETMPRMSSTLNPNAPLYVPASFLATEDFSPEWWNLIQTSPAFRDYWLRERSPEIMEEESSPLDDIDDLDFEDLLEMEIQCEESENAGRKPGNGAVRNMEKDVLSALALDVNPHQRIWREPLKCHDKILNKTPRSPRKSGNNQFRIQQPRPQM